LGLADLGYKYINIDDCWQAAQRDKNGHVQVDPVNFPGLQNGMKDIGDAIHAKGLWFGLYSSAGSKTCAGRAGSLGYEMIDA